MSTSLYDLSVGSYLQMLEAAVGFLAKGAEQFAAAGVDPNGAVSFSLYTDMAPFHFQAVGIVHHSLAALRMG